MTGTDHYCRTNGREILEILHSHVVFGCVISLEPLPGSPYIRTRTYLLLVRRPAVDRTQETQFRKGCASWIAQYVVLPVASWCIYIRCRCCRGAMLRARVCDAACWGVRVSGLLAPVHGSACTCARLPSSRCMCTSLSHSCMRKTHTYTQNTCTYAHTHVHTHTTHDTRHTAHAHAHTHAHDTHLCGARNTHMQK